MRLLTILGLAALAVCQPAFADPWKDESGHGWYRGGAWKEEFDDGTCRVERKMKRNGAYKEEVTCDGPPWAGGTLAPPVVVVQDWPPPTIALPPLPQGPHYGAMYEDDTGRYCREYQTSAVIDGRRQRLYGTACLEADGAWSFNN